MYQFLRSTLAPLFLIVTCPVTVILFWYINTHCHGSISEFMHLIVQYGFFSLVWKIWEPVFFGTTTAWKMIIIFMAAQFFLLRAVPGKSVTGPESPKGHIPVYKDNGFLCFLITVFSFYLCTHVLKLFPASIIYDNFAGILGALNIFSLWFCLWLYYRGRYKPSSRDHSSSGNFIFDYYWGTELYPQLFQVNVKQFTNCRFGMMSWAVIIISFAAKQTELYGLSNSMLACVSIMLVYIGKFFWWESGYFRSLDIMHDRAGFYICWGCLVWVPGVYTLPAMYLVNHPMQFPVSLAIAITLLGITCVMLNYVADRQRQKVRATDGQCTVWGKAPKLIHATYVDHLGQTKQSILLASGFWGLSRHFHYVLEILLAFFWTLPALFFNFLPWFYVIFLTILLVHRAHRDDARCKNKYGDYWTEYCNLVPRKIIPW